VSAPAHDLRLAVPAAGLNHILCYGQSLSTGWEGWPALSTTPRADACMLGASVRPRRENAPRFEPVDGAELRPLVATVQDRDSGRVLTAAEVAGLPAGSLALGETVLEGAIAQLAASAPLASATRLLASACGVGGRTLEALSCGARPELFHRLREAALLGRQAATGQGLDYRVLALLLLQGEHNAWGLDGGSADRATYRGLLARLYHDMVAELAVRVAGQPRPPALFLYQTGGAYATDTLDVAMAQLDLALGLPGCFLAAPVYAVTDKGGHLDANGYRWLGAQFGKVMHRVLVLGEVWRPLHPLAAVAVGGDVHVRFAVPVPPLVWGRPCAGQRPADVADRGFTLLDAAGEVPLRQVAFAGADTVALSPARPLRPPLVLRYADRRHHGLGALCDQDATVAATDYSAVAVGDAAAREALAALLGRPYPLANWCVAFAIPVTVV
jgi:hypothetical protein